MQQMEVLMINVSDLVDEHVKKSRGRQLLGATTVKERIAAMLNKIGVVKQDLILVLAMLTSFSVNTLKEGARESDLTVLERLENDFYNCAAPAMEILQNEKAELQSRYPAAVMFLPVVVPDNDRRSNMLKAMIVSDCHAQLDVWLCCTRVCKDWQPLLAQQVSSHTHGFHDVACTFDIAVQSATARSDQILEACSGCAQGWLSRSDRQRWEY
jgi:hypothetical protein